MILSEILVLTGRVYFTPWVIDQLLVVEVVV